MTTKSPSLLRMLQILPVHPISSKNQQIHPHTIIYIELLTSFCIFPPLVYIYNNMQQKTQGTWAIIQQQKWPIDHTYIYTWLFLGLRPANDRQRYFVTTSLIGWEVFIIMHDKVMTCKYFPYHWPFMQENHLWLVVNSPHKRPEMWSFDIFVVILKGCWTPSSFQWFEMPRRSCDIVAMVWTYMYWSSASFVSWQETN